MKRRKATLILFLAALVFGCPGDSDGVYSLPTTYVIDQSGMVVMRYIGEQNWDSPKIRSKIEALLNRSSRAPRVSPEASPVLF